MGKYKQYLMAQDEDLDVTDSKDTFSPPDKNEPEPQDWYMHDLMTAVINLSKNMPYGYEKELKESIKVLNGILKTVRKPF